MCAPFLNLPNEELRIDTHDMVIIRSIYHISPDVTVQFAEVFDVCTILEQGGISEQPPHHIALQTKAAHAELSNREQTHRQRNAEG